MIWRLGFWGGHKPTAQTVDEFIGERLRTLRSERGVSRSAAARALGVTEDRFAKFEQGLAKLSAKQLFKVASHFDVSVATFFDRSAVSK